MNYNLRVKGLYTEYPNGIGVVPSNKDPFDGNKQVIASSFLMAKGASFLRDLNLYILPANLVNLKYTNFYKKYSLKGRKIN